MYPWLTPFCLHYNTVNPMVQSIAIQCLCVAFSLELRWYNSGTKLECSWMRQSGWPRWPTDPWGPFLKTASYLHIALPIIWTEQPIKLVKSGWFPVHHYYVNMWWITGRAPANQELPLVTLSNTLVCTGGITLWFKFYIKGTICVAQGEQ